LTRGNFPLPPFSSPPFCVLWTFTFPPFPSQQGPRSKGLALPPPFSRPLLPFPSLISVSPLMASCPLYFLPLVLNTFLMSFFCVFLFLISPSFCSPPSYNSIPDLILFFTPPVEPPFTSNTLPCSLKTVIPLVCFLPHVRRTCLPLGTVFAQNNYVRIPPPSFPFPPTGYIFPDPVVFVRLIPQFPFVRDLKLLF